MLQFARIALTILVANWLARDAPAEPQPPAAVAAPPHRIDVKHLPNAVRVHPRVISGGLPEGAAGFAELQKLGVKTVVSVDGARPDVGLARRHGLRYVHLPHGYDGIGAARAKELAKAVRDLPGPVYIHCHHGKHRSPAAAAAACVTAGLIPESEAIDVLKLAETSPHYAGLFGSVRSAAPLDAAALDKLQVEWREVTPPPPLVEAMITLEQTHDRLKVIETHRWRTPPEHPDLDPAHEALLLREHFTELLRAEAVQQEPPKFKQLLRDSERAARELETALRRDQPPEVLSRLHARVTADCRACHRQFRDRPLNEPTP